LNAVRKLGICTIVIALVSSSAGADTRIYGALASNYVFRGYSLSDDRASASAGVDWQHLSGIYAGGNVSSVESGAEWDVYAGYTREFGPVALDFGGSSYEYTDDGYIDGGFRELYVGAQVGPVALSIYRGYSPFTDHHYWYSELDAGVPAGPVTVELHYGVSDYDFFRESDQYAGVARRWRGLDWRLRLTHIESDDNIHYVFAVTRNWTLNR
jgi:uncharacterized protein (TIGR02001 family)